MQLNVLPGQRISFRYKNWRGETAERHAEVKEIWFGSTEYHRNPQWLMRAVDLEKGAERDFAMADMYNVRPLADQPA